MASSLFGGVAPADRRELATDDTSTQAIGLVVLELAEKVIEKLLAAGDRVIEESPALALAILPIKTAGHLMMVCTKFVHPTK